MMSFVKELEVKHGEKVRDCSLYHLILGSSQKPRPIFDFGGDYSITAFIERLHQEFFPPEKN